MFTREKHDTREKWLASRNAVRTNDFRLSGTEASVCCGDNPWTDICELYDIKMGLTTRPDISNRPQIRYGVDMEPIIRAAMMVDLPYFSLSYRGFDILKSIRYPWMTCTLDGELEIVTEDNPWGFPAGTRGILECKTGSFRKAEDLAPWEEGIPVYYYEQMVHCLAVTGWDFAICAARLKRDAYRDEDQGFPEIRNFYRIVDMRSPWTQQDMRQLVDIESQFLNENLKKKVRPARRLVFR